jgi:hypothetical protein
MKRLMMALAAAGALCAGAAVSAAPSTAPASAIGSGSAANAPATNTGTASTQAANPAVVATAPEVPAAPPIPSNAQSCVGSVVSTTAHGSQQVLDQGLGTYLHNLGQNPGQDIQRYATNVCGKH